MNQFITLEPDLNIEPGHQWLVMPLTTATRGLAALLLDEPVVKDEFIDVLPFGDLILRIPHNEVVDKNIVDLINQLAHVRFSAPGLVQLELVEAHEEPA